MPKHDLQEQVNQLSKAVDQWQARGRGISPAPQAAELAKVIDISLSNVGAGEDELAKAVSEYLHYSPNTARPEFYKLLYSGVNPNALLGDWVTGLCNSTMHTYQVGPVATLMELELIRRLTTLSGYDAEQADGVMVAGGSQANLIGMMLARHRCCPQFKAAGNQTESRVLRAYVSDQAHYSYERAINLLGLGTDNLVKVPSNEDGEIDPESLAALIQADLELGRQPFFIGLTAGTTVVGAFDSVKSCHQVAQAHGVWLHIDGAWGAPVLFSEKHRHLLADSGLADSIAWDAHKLMNVPITAAFILVKQKGQLTDCIAGGGGDYLFHADENEAYNLGQKSIQCGRRADSLKVWLSWKASGDQGFASKIEYLFGLKAACLEMLDRHDNLELIGPAGFLNVLFRFVPSKRLSESELAQLNREICKTMVRQGGPHIDFAQYKNRTGIRLILANDAASKQGLEELFDMVVRLGQELT